MPVAAAVSKPNRVGDGVSDLWARPRGGPLTFQTPRDQLFPQDSKAGTTKAALPRRARRVHARSDVQEAPCCRLAPSYGKKGSLPLDHRRSTTSLLHLAFPSRCTTTCRAAPHLCLAAIVRASPSPGHVSNLRLPADRGGPSSTTTSFSPSVSTVVCPVVPAGHPRSAPCTPRHGTVLFARLLVHHCVDTPAHERPGPDGRCRRPLRSAALVVPRLWVAAKRRHRPPAAPRPHAPTCR